MSNSTFPALCALSLALTLAACSGGQGGNDTLVDGAVDRQNNADTRSGAEDVGPPSASSAAAGPAAAGTVAGGQAAGASPAAPATAGATLTLATQGGHGPHLADASGAAVYHLEGDRDGSKCVGDCLAAWPPVLMTGTQPSGGTGLQGGMIASIARPDGSRQVTYNNLPLYRYAADAGAGATNGHGVKDKYGAWHLVSGQGTPIAAAHAGH